LAEAFERIGLHAVDRVHDLGHDDVPLFHAEAVKGLEFDGVVVVNPHEIFDGSALGARLLYVALTRAVQVLHIVTRRPPPPPSPDPGARHVGSRGEGNVRPSIHHVGVRR
jgi:superfamily I DNA/RNA helicase